VTERRRTWSAVVAVVLALGLVLAGQSLADVAAPSAPNGALTGEAMGRAGFAYLTGLRKFAAALLWNRLDPQMHQYYGGHVGLGKMIFMLPNIKAITMLDPQFVEAYYVAPEILIESGHVQTGLALAKEGVTNNPKSGELLTSYEQYLLTVSKDVPAALRYADMATRPDTVWRSDEERFDGLAIVRDTYKMGGLPAKEAAVQAVMTRIANDPNATSNPADTGE
jgi:hypothetical protein